VLETSAAAQVPQCPRLAHLYPSSGEHRFTVLDDLDDASLARLSADSFNPCAVVETSSRKFSRPG